MKPDRKIPQNLSNLESDHIHHFTTTGKMDIPYREKFHIVVRRFRTCSKATHSTLVIDLRTYITNK